MVDAPIDTALDQAERMIARAAYEAALSAIDACDQMEGAAARQPRIRVLRLLISHVYERDDDEIAQRIDQYLALPEDVPIELRISSVGAACVGRARLASTYLPSLLAEARTALESAETDQRRRWLEEEISTTLELCVRLGVSSG